ncbi:hypothetical protein [Mucilaginibacter sp.]|uniref:hypothetical protein n=1 Tax=Mucilaginibacter sp. TaxID=1882438 RepID=UPI003B004DEC
MISFEVFIESFAIGNIYWFINPQINSTDPHPHLCVGVKDKSIAFLICGTSQFEKKKRYFELTGLPFETLVRLEPNSNNFLYKHTYINCNEIQEHSISELFTTSGFRFFGTISDSELYQVRNGLEISELLEQDTKDFILKSFPEI